MSKSNTSLDRDSLFTSFTQSYQSLYFTNCTIEDLHEVYNYTNIFIFDKDTIIYNEGDEVKYFYLLISGKIEITKHTDTGLDRTLGILSPGDFFGVPELFFPTHRVSTSTVEKTILGRIKKEDFFTNLIGVKTFMLDCLRTACGVLAEAQDEMVISKAETKVIVYLYWLSKSYGIDRGSSIYITKKQTHEEIATILSLSRETITRTMNILKKENLIGFEKKHIIIYDIKKLEKLKTHNTFIGLYGKIDYELDCIETVPKNN